MTAGYDVVVIGGGVVGASIGFELARHRLGRVLVVDKAPGPGHGSTGASSSICRTRYSNDEVVRLAVDGLSAYRNWSEYLGLSSVEAGFVETGALWIADRSPSDLAAEVGRLNSLGASAEMLDASTVKDRYPALSVCTGGIDWERDHDCTDGEVFLFEDRAGYIDPMDTLGDVLMAARSNGADVRFATGVVGLETSGGRVSGVKVTGGNRIEADLVVNASGPWCNRLNEMAGLTHRWSFVPTRIQTLYREWPADLGEVPVTLDVATGVYLRPERRSGMVWVGSVREEDEREVVEDPDSFAVDPGAAFRDRTLAMFGHRVPGLQLRGAVSGIAGLYTINRQDVHPVVGPSGIDGYWLANGFSGHGFKLAPMVGSMVASALGGTAGAFDTRVPIGLFAIDRDPIGVDARNVLA